MKRGLQSFVFLFLLLFVLSGPNVFGQGRDEGGFVEKIKIPVIQRGARSPEVITSLDASYCSQGGSVDIYLDPADIPSGTIRVVWTILTNVGSIEEEHNDWVDPIGTDPNNGVRFFPDRVPSEFYGDAIFFKYQFYDGNITAGGDYDWTYVYKSPEIYTVTPAELHLCSGTTGTVTLSNSESGYEYFLYKDGVEQTFIGGDDGVPLDFTVPAPAPSASPVVYTIEARRSSEPRCTVSMSGQTEVYGYDNPVPAPSSNSPVCEGESIVLEDSNAPVSGYQYIWEGPGLLVGGQTGHTVTVTDPLVIDNSGDYIYNLTIIDTNNPAYCEATESITVTVNDNPVVNNIYNDSPACVGDDVTISIDVSGGSGPYTFTWTGPNGFASTDEDPVLSNITLADAGTYEVVVTDVNGCGSTIASTEVVVNENPVISDISNDSPVCEGGTVNLSVTVTGGSGPYTYSWTGPNGFASTDEDPVLSDITLTDAGNYNVVVTDANGCGTTTSSTVVSVNENPVIDNINNDGPACAGGTVNLSVTVSGGIPPYSYLWSGPDGFSSTDQNPSVTNVTTANAGDYDVVVTDANGCSVTGTTNVIVSDPVIDNINNNGPVCEGSAVTLNVSVSGGITPYSYSWSGPAGFSSTAQNPTITNVTLANAGDYDVTVTDANGCIVSGSTTVTVNENPVIDDVSNDGPVCEGGTLNLSVTASGGTGPYTYFWSGPAGFSSTDQNPTITNITLANAGDYDVVVTDANGCGSATGSTTVVVNENPVIDNINNDGPVCAGGTVNLSVTVSGGMPPYSYLWSGPDGFSSTAQNPSVTNVTTANAGDYDVVVTDANGCSVTGTTNVIVSDPVIDNINNNGPVCEGSAVTLNVSVSGGIAPYSYSWSGPAGFSSTAKDTTITNVTLANAGDYDVTVTDANGCIVSGSTTVVVNENPVIDNVSNDGPVCEGGTLNLSVTASGGTGPYTYFWSGPAGFSSTDQNPTITNITLANAGDYDVVVTDANGCGSATGSTTVVVNENPVIDNINNDGPVCAGGTLNLSVSVSGGSTPYTYSWSGPDGFASSDQNPSITNVTLANAGDYAVVVTDANGCSSTPDTTTVIVNSLPTVTLDDASTCDGQDITLTASSSGGSGNYVNYVWYDAGGNVIASGYSSQLTLTGTDVELANNGATYSVTVEDDNGCISAADDMILTVNENPTVTINTGDPEMDICAGDDLVLDANVTGGNGSYSYQWELPDGSTMSGSPINVPAVTVSNEDGFYVVTAEDGNGCIATDSIDVNVIDINATLTASATTVCENNREITFTAGGGDQYEFFLYDSNSGSWNNAQGPDTNNLYITDQLNDGDSVYVEVSGSGCSGISDTLGVTVKENPELGGLLAASKTEACEGDPINIGVEEATGGDGNYVYEWYKDEDGLISSGAENIYSIGNTTLTDDGNYKVVAIDNSGAGCPSDTVFVDVTVQAFPVVDLIADPSSALEGTEVTFTADTTGNSTAETFIFFNGTDTVQAESTNNTYVTSELEDGDSISVQVFSSLNCRTDDYLIMNVYEGVAIPDINVTNRHYCEDDNGATFEVTNPQVDVTYELILEDGSPSGRDTLVHDGNNDIIWDNVLSINMPADTITSYVVKAYREEVPDDFQLSDTIQVVEHPKPSKDAMTVYDENGQLVEEDTVECNDGGRYIFGLGSGFDASTTYELILNGDVDDPLERKTTPESGNPGLFSFDKLYSFIGTYTIRAVSGFGCTEMMEGSFTIDGGLAPYKSDNLFL